jgi:ABC-2 type transport system permease protein
VTSLNHGVYSQDNIYLNVAVTCGSSRPIAPAFIDRDTPIEYELVRAICTVTEQKRKKVGVVTTDAPLYGSFNMQTMAPSTNWPIIDDLEKQYQVVKVDPSKPITEKFDVLLAVQPSTLGPEEMKNFVAAVASGQPTAIFEDPAPMLCNVPASSMPRQSPGGMNPMMRMQAPPKGNVKALWSLLGVDFPDAKIVSQDFNPYPKFPPFQSNKEFVFVDPGSGAKEAFNTNDPISSGVQQVLFAFPGFIAKSYTSNLTFTPLANTSEKTGTLLFSELMEMTPFGPPRINQGRSPTPTNTTYCLAAHIQGKVTLPPPVDEPFKGAEGKKDEKEPAEKKPVESTINVVVATDVDLLAPAFFALREQGEIPEIGVHIRLDNVTFVLNALDSLAGDDRFIEIRKRRPSHRTLARIEEETKEPRKKAAEAREQYVKEYQDLEKAEQKAIEDKVAELNKRKDMDSRQLLIEVAMMQQDLERQRAAKLEQARRDKDRKTNKIENELASKVRDVQFWHKLWAVLLPPIFPLMVAIGVFVVRRVREREGVAKSRLR